LLIAEIVMEISDTLKLVIHWQEARWVLKIVVAEPPGAALILLRDFDDHLGRRRLMIADDQP
jgi:hypothetical protein